MDKLKSLIESYPKGLDDLAKSSSIDRERLDEFREGCDPNLGELRALSKALSMPLSGFAEHEGSAEAEKAKILFRRSPHGKATESNLAAYEQLAQQIAFMFEVEKKDRKSPSWLAEIAVREQNWEEAERAAIKFRDRHFGGDKLDPLYDLPRLLSEELGVVVIVIPGKTFDGASAIVEGQPFIFVSPRFSGRMLFTVAHELGHLVAHLGEQEEYALIDEEVGKEFRRTGGRRAEAFADAFAAALLLPQKGVAVTLKVIRKQLKAKEDALGDLEILALARVYGVSFQVAAMRCEHLQLLPTGGAKSLYDWICQKHGSPEKRADEAGLPGRPEVQFPPIPEFLLRKVFSAVQDGAISIGKAAAHLNLTIKQLMELNKQEAGSRWM